MSVDDCFVPFHSPLREPTAYDRWGKGPQPCWSQLDLDKCAAGGSQGQGGADRRILQFLNRPLAVPPRRLPPPLGPLPKLSEPPSQHKENLPEEPKQRHPAQPAVSSAASRGRYARSRAGWASKDRSTPCIRSRAACASKERSAPEGINMEEHGFRFQFTFPEPDYGEYGSDFGEEEECLPRQRKPPEVRNALREKRVAFRQKTGRHHAKVALRKYNRANNTKFELVEVPVIREFWEFGGGCIHYNFTAKQAEDHRHSADADNTKLFFSEVNSAFHGDKDVVLCCIVGEHDNGHCYGCEGFKPTVVHPSSQAYGGGSSTCIDFAGSDGSSESD
ncbi:unnamed protein product [Triticum turgidum subsp. durum]|uniref:DUF3615 domain-containing protein n=1 Tax=Triticum turgidum subsp. durum TaxID=4567 RepID=A0A9R0WXF9_TRITD|nr:unnamed protein product [Triticum turgidum subsp. durum]